MIKLSLTWKLSPVFGPLIATFDDLLPCLRPVDGDFTLRGTATFFLSRTQNVSDSDTSIIRDRSFFVMYSGKHEIISILGHGIKCRSRGFFIWLDVGDALYWAGSVGGILGCVCYWDQMVIFCDVFWEA